MSRAPIPDARSRLAWLEYYELEWRAALANCSADSYEGHFLSDRIAVVVAVRKQLDTGSHTHMHYGEARVFVKLIEDAALVTLNSPEILTDATLFAIALGIVNRIRLLEMDLRYREDLERLRRSVKK